MVAASLWVTLGAMIVGAPLGICGAIFLSEFAPRPVMRVIKPTIELLAAIPSVVYGFIGVMVLAPFIRSSLGGPGLSLLAASIILGIMILPTIISISIDSILAVPQSYREGSLALGATVWQTIHMVTIRAARSGIIASIILGMGRAIGETMAVIMVAGNAVKIPHSVLDSVRSLTANIALEMSYATGLHREALFATGVVLFLVIVILNSIAMLAMKKRVGNR
jgi:phosphate ABC transporter permease protein PstC